MPFTTEDKFVRWLQRRWPRPGRNVRLGIGDDAAVVRTTRGFDLALTTDLSIEGVHFRRDLHPPRAVGHRALARALSDLAAVGARARFALLSLAVPRATSRAWLSGFYSGVGSLARRYGVTLIGGDTAVAEGGITVDVVAAGDVKHGRELRRDGARPGDLLFVTGRLGAAALGLELLRSGGTRAASRASRQTGMASETLQASLYPEPRLDVGQYLVKRRLASAAIDVSDGFARDLGRLCAASGCAALIREASLPLLQGGAALGSSTKRILERTSREPHQALLGLALRGGDDYELIFSAPRTRARRVPGSIGGVAIHAIGEVRGGRGLRLLRGDGREAALSTRGFDHFGTYGSSRTGADA